MSRVLLAAMVLVIVVTAALLYLLDNILGIDIPLEVHAALLLLAGAAGSPLAAAVTQKVGVSPAIAVSTMVTVVLATIIAEPLVVALFMPEGIDISPGDVTRVILTGILIPMGIGLSIRTWWVTAADLITAPMTKISSALLNVLIILIIVKDLKTMLSLGVSNLLLMAFVVALWLAIGHFVGGPSLSDRMSLGITSAWRSGAVAMLVAVQGFGSAVPALVAVQLIIMVVALPYVSIVGKKTACTGIRDAFRATS